MRIDADEAAAVALRGRPSRGRNLSRAKLLEVAARLADDRGPAGLSLRRLAQAVNVTPMAIYNHFANKRALLSAVADHMLAGAEFDGGYTDWREQIRYCFGVVRALCLRHPGLPFLLREDDVASQGVFAPMEVTLRALNGAGLDDLAGLRTYFLLVAATLNQAAYEVGGGSAALDPALADRETLTAVGYTRVAQMVIPHPWDFDASHGFAIDLVLEGAAGIAARDNKG